MWTASFYLEAAASQWYYPLEKNRGSAPTWPKFIQSITKCFGPLVRSNSLGALTQLRCTGTVDEF